MIALTPRQARRLAILKQRLAGPRPAPTRAGILELVRDLGCLQIDPIRAVERTHYLVLWSRLGSYDRDDLDHLLYEEKALFEYWAHAASIVLTENYPIHNWQMRQFARGESAWERKARAWLRANEGFERYIQEELRQHGMRLTSEFEDRTSVAWESGGWTHRQSVRMMLSMLWERGKIMVGGRRGQQKQWVLAEDWLANTPRQPLPAQEVTRRAAQIALRALGVGTARHISNHFIRGSYPNLEEGLAALQEEGRILPVAIEGWPGEWFMHAADLPLLERLEATWQPRTTLLSPFDNLIADRERTEQMWDFFFRIEIYVPATKREYGYYVLPILHGERLIGRIDPKMDRKRGVLYIQNIYAEVDAPSEAGEAIAASIADLAAWLGATRVEYGANLPGIWRSAL